VAVADSKSQRLKRTKETRRSYIKAKIGETLTMKTTSMEQIVLEIINLATGEALSGPWVQEVIKFTHASVHLETTLSW